MRIEKGGRLFVSAGEKLLPSEKYLMSERQTNDYSWEMNLTIRSIERADFVGYICAAENALGRAEGAVRLQGIFTFLFGVILYPRFEVDLQLNILLI